MYLYFFKIARYRRIHIDISVSNAGTVVDLTPGFVALATALLQRVTFSRNRLVPLIVSPRKEDIELVTGMVKQGRLKTVIDSR
jgi:chloroplastic oxoene reductase